MKRKMLSTQQSPRRAMPLAGLSVPALVLALAGSALGADPLTTVSAAPVNPVSKVTFLGNAPASQKLSLVIGLKMANLPGLEAFSADVNNPKSLHYHQYLTPTQIGARFGAPSANVLKVTTYLQKYFTKVTPMSNGTAVLVDGTVSQVKSAFGSVIALYKGTAADLPVGSPNFYVNLTAPKMPKSVADLVTGVTGLENFYRLKPHTASITPSQARTLYSVNSLYDEGYKGAGVTVATSNFEFFRRSNLPLFYSTYGLPTPTGGVGSNVRVMAVAGGTGETDPVVGPASEGDLDIQMVLSQAPLCNLVVYDAPNSVANSIFVLQREAQDNAVDIITESYGFPVYSGTFPFLVQKHAAHVAMSAQGITYLVSSGDDGTYPPIIENPSGTDPVPQSGNDIDPESLIVGGTVATIDNLGNRLSEVGWSGSGGGWTAYTANGLDFNKRPDWQKNIAIPDDATHNFRLYPDVALHAAGDNITDFGAYAYVFGGQISAVSGTSASSPLFAGQLAVLLQKLKANDYIDSSEFSGAFRLGHIQEALYGFAADATFATSFTDILTGNNGVLPDGTDSNAGPGWDFVTGLGAPILSQLYTNYTSLASDLVTDTADAADIYTASTPTITFGTSPQGDASNLTSTDAISYSVLSVKQNGVGQVAAATFGFTLQSDTTTRRGASLRLSLMSDRLTTDFIYLYNYTTGVYDLVKTVGATGSMSSVISVPLDEGKYIQDDQVQVLARGLKPARLGNVPFRLSVDQATIVERVAPSS